MITIEQIKAARALLGLKQSELATASNISLTSLNNIERGVTSPRVKTLEGIKSSLESFGIEFIRQDGVCQRQEHFNVEIVEGKEVVQKWLNDIIKKISIYGGDTLMSGIDEREFVARNEKELARYYKLFEQKKWKEKILICESDEFLYAPSSTTEYRWVDKSIFTQVPYAVYGNSYSIMTWGPPERVIIIENQTIADSARQQFMVHWNNATIISDQEKLK